MRDMLQASNGQQRLDAEDMRMHALRNLQHQTTSKPAAASSGVAASSALSRSSSVPVRKTADSWGMPVFEKYAFPCVFVITTTMVIT